MGPTSEGMGEEGRGRKRVEREREGRGEEGREVRPPFQIPGSATGDERQYFQLTDVIDLQFLVLIQSVQIY